MRKTSFDKKYLFEELDRLATEISERVNLTVGRKTEQFDLHRFEKKMERKATILIYTPHEWEEKTKKDKAFYERILIDGIVLQGNLPVVK